MIFFRALAPAVFPAVVGVVFFSAAGRLDLPVVWTLLAVLAAFLLGMMWLGDPGMVRERVSPGPVIGTG